MLSLQGSIQPDPFSPEHVPHRPSDSRASTPSSHASYHPYVTATDPQSQIPAVNGDGDVSVDEEEEEEEQFGGDTFMDLVRLEREEAARQRREAERIEKKTQKRKRREEDTTDKVKEAGASTDDGKNTGKREKKKHKKSKTAQDTTR